MDNLSALRSFLEHSRVVAFVAVNPDGTIDECNRAFCRLAKRKQAEVIGENAVNFLSAGDAESFPALLSGEWEPPAHLLMNVVDEAFGALTLECSFERRGDRLILYGEPVQASEDELRNQLLDMNNQLAVMARENARKSAALERAAEELDRSYWHVKKIQEVLPICMECGQVKNETGWESVVEYLKRNALFLSHGYCPDCFESLMARDEFGLSETGDQG